MMLPVEIRTIGQRFTGQQGLQGNPVAFARTGKIDQIQDRVVQVVPHHHGVFRTSFLGHPGSTNHHGHPQTTFIQLHFEPTQSAVGTKELRVKPPQFKSRAVVAGEDHDRVVPFAPCFDRVEDSSEVAIHAGDHRGVRRPRRGVWQVTSTAFVGRIVPPLVVVIRDQIRRRLQRQVRHDRGNVHEPRLIFGHRVQPSQSIFANGIRPPSLAQQTAIVPGQQHHLIVCIEISRKKVVGVELAQVAVEPVEAKIFGVTMGFTHAAQPPFTKSTSGVAGLLQLRGQGGRAFGHGPLAGKTAFHLGQFTVVADG